MSNMNVLTHYMIYKLHGNGRHGWHEMTSHKDKNYSHQSKEDKIKATISHRYYILSS